jgi:hypothetical protein
MNGPKIRCGKCGTPVLKTEWWNDPLTHDFVVRVYCHGESEVTNVPVEFFARPQVIEAIAFKPKEN